METLPNWPASPLGKLPWRPMCRTQGKFPCRADRAERPPAEPESARSPQHRDYRRPGTERHCEPLFQLPVSRVHHFTFTREYDSLNAVFWMDLHSAGAFGGPSCPKGLDLKQASPDTIHLRRAVRHAQSSPHNIHLGLDTVRARGSISRYYVRYAAPPCPRIPEKRSRIQASL